MPAHWTELRDNWNIWAKRQELDSVPALIPDCDCAPEGPVDTSTPCKESAAGAQHRMRNRRESEIHQVQLQAILEGRENVETPGLASRKTNERNSQMPKTASKRRRSPSKRRMSTSKRRRSPSVPSRKSPRLGMQNGGSALLEGNGCKENDTAGSRKQGKQGSKGSKGVRAGAKARARARAREEGSFACTQCQFTAASRWHFERHQKTHQKKVASEVSASAVIDSGCPSKKTVSQEENDLGAQPTSNNRMNTSRASAVKARTRCAKIAEEEEE